MPDSCSTCCGGTRTSRRRSSSPSTPPTGCCSTSPATLIAALRAGRGRGRRRQLRRADPRGGRPARRAATSGWPRTCWSASWPSPATRSGPDCPGRTGPSRSAPSSPAVRGSCWSRRPRPSTRCARSPRWWRRRRRPTSRVLVGGRVKHMTHAMNDVLGDSFAEVSASLARQKSRVLVARGPEARAVVLPAQPGPPRPRAHRLRPRRGVRRHEDRHRHAGAARLPRPDGPGQHGARPGRRVRRARRGTRPQPSGADRAGGRPVGRRGRLDARPPRRRTASADRIRVVRDDAAGDRPRRQRRPRRLQPAVPRRALPSSPPPPTGCSPRPPGCCAPAASCGRSTTARCATSRRWPGSSGRPRSRRRRRSSRSRSRPGADLGRSRSPAGGFEKSSGFRCSRSSEWPKIPARRARPRARSPRSTARSRY